MYTGTYINKNIWLHTARPASSLEATGWFEKITFTPFCEMKSSLQLFNSKCCMNPYSKDFRLSIFYVPTHLNCWGESCNAVLLWRSRNGVRNYNRHSICRTRWETMIIKLTGCYEFECCAFEHFEPHKLQVQEDDDVLVCAQHWAICLHFTGIKKVVFSIYFFIIIL